VALKDSIWSIEKLADPKLLLSRAAKSTSPNEAKHV
jgi:hypothetical protein